ncbi:hypothetical protein [Paenibacillus wynnii]|uniref:hypothetical protein n=1 Tax=Paenibacillus wynnii TaxID=268407 RepID=UPI00278D3C6F|nr:hypothetical protein [Paenibacillus wynnii]MDQ0196836.1 hypothetical protein [Paenibacillus wynnii]
MLKLKRFTGLLLVLVIAALSPADAFAASVVQLTPDIKASYDETAAVADSATKARLTNLYAELVMLQTQYDSREERIRVLHYKNEQMLSIVRKQIREIDAGIVSPLEAQTKSTKERYQPLFDQYSSLSRRISIARNLKDKNLNAVLNAQGDAMRVLVQLARQDIRDKEAKLKTAKETRSLKIAAARKTLSSIESSQTEIKSRKSVVTALNKRLSADWSSFKSAIRKHNPMIASQSLSSLVSMLRQIAGSKQTIEGLEQRISVVIERTKAQISS